MALDIGAGVSFSAWAALLELRRSQGIRRGS